MGVPEIARVLALQLADGVGRAEPATAGLILELVRRPGAQAHRSILLGHEAGWQDLVEEALRDSGVLDLEGQT